MLANYRLHLGEERADIGPVGEQGLGLWRACALGVLTQDGQKRGFVL